MKKLFCCSGETLTETLVSILIIALSSLLLLSLILAAGHITAAASAKSDALAAAWDNAEKKSGAATGTVTITGDYIGSISVTATPEDSGLVAYWK